MFHLLFPIWVLYQTNNNKKMEMEISMSKIKKKDSFNVYDGFDLTKNNSVINVNNDLKNQTKLQKINHHIRNLKRLNFLQSSFVSEIEKLKCAEEVLLDEDLHDILKNKNKNSFWETFEDIFF
jgi:hypothetical protein